MSEILGKIAEAIYNGEEDEAKKLAQEVIDTGVDPETAIKQGGIVGLDKLGADYEELIVFLPELMMAADAMKAFIGILKPYLAADSDSTPGTVVIGCAKGDLHDIGKDLVGTQLAVNGFNVIDLGVDVSPNEFVNTARSNNADIIAISSLLTTSAYYMEEMVNNLTEDGMRGDFKVLVGGGPINAGFAKDIGADGYARTAFGGVEVCKKLVKMDKVDEVVVGE